MSWPNSLAYRRPAASQASPARCGGRGSTPASRGTGCPGAGRPSVVTRRILPPSEERSCAAGRLPGVAGGDVEVAVGAEREPAAVVVVGLGDAVDDHRPRAQRVAVQGHPHDAVVVGRGEVDEDAAVGGEPGGDGDPEQARLTQRLRRRALCRPGPAAAPPSRTRSTVPWSRSVTRAEPSGRKASPQGTWRPAGDGDRCRRERRGGRRGSRTATGRTPGTWSGDGAGHRDEVAGGEVAVTGFDGPPDEPCAPLLGGAGAEGEQCGGGEQCQ